MKERRRVLSKGSQGHHEPQAGGSVEKPTLCQGEKELEVAPILSNTLLILGAVISYVLFFPLERERHGRCQSSVMGRQRFMALSVFWVFSCPRPASGRSTGPAELPAAGGFGKERGNSFSSGAGSRQVVLTVFPQACWTLH
jgi:hypothetical protein